MRGPPPTRHAHRAIDNTDRHVRELQREVAAFNVRDTPGGTPGIFRMVVKQVDNDYLTCRTIIGSTEGTDTILVAKPWNLQHVLEHYPQLTTLTTVNANTVDVSDGSTNERWVVTPDYTIEGEIYAGRVRDTNVIVATEPLVFIDLTNRAWAIE